MINKDNMLSVILTLCLPFLLGATKPNQPKIEHTEVMYKDVTGDGVEEKLVFSYSGPELIHLDVSFRIYQIDPKTKKEKQIFYEGWDTWRIYDDVHGPDYSIDKVRAYITDFFSGLCFDSSKNKLCQTKCLGSLWCREGEIKRSIAMALMGKEEYNQWNQWYESNIKTVWKAINKRSKDPNFKTSIWEELDRVLLSSMPVDKKKVEQVFKEMFMENDITCFSYEPYPEALGMYLWSPSLSSFLLIGGCH